MYFSLLDVIFPRRCLGCGKFGGYLCERCRLSLALHKYTICPVCEKASADGRTHASCRTKYSVDGATFIFAYKSPITNLIKALKYKFGKEIVSILVDCALQEIAKLYIPPKDFSIVPIPLHERRSNWRGFNQSELIGREIAKHMGWNFRNDLLSRPRFRKPQTEVREASKRKDNVRKTFDVNKSLVINHKPLIIFDDVWTTGSTMKEATRVLKRNGTKFVWGLTIAR